MIPSSKAKPGRWLPAGLIALSAVPVGAGAVRLASLASGVVTPDNARFFASPAPVALHVVSASAFCVVGALQFVPGLRRGRSSWHARAGRLLTACGVLAALSGLWMTVFYPRVAGDGDVLEGLRLLFGSAMVACAALGFAAIRRRNFALHAAWMTRAYAIGMGAGTQALVHLLWLPLFGKPGEPARAVLMGAGWTINLVVAEWSTRRRPSLVNRGGAVVHNGTTPLSVASTPPAALAPAKPAR
jgi:hypothetical protein